MQPPSRSAANVPVTPDEHFAYLESLKQEPDGATPRVPVGGPKSESAERPQAALKQSGKAHARKPLVLEPHLVELLRGVIDPELGIDIVALGLLREARAEEHTVHVTFTVTMPSCPMPDYLEDEIRRCLKGSEEIDEVIVSLVNEPPWTAADMSDEARATLGWTP